jgi:hypothetical protein
VSTTIFTGFLGLIDAIYYFIKRDLFFFHQPFFPAVANLSISLCLAFVLAVTSF